MVNIDKDIAHPWIARLERSEIEKGPFLFGLVTFLSFYGKVDSSD